MYFQVPNSLSLTHMAFLFTYCKIFQGPIDNDRHITMSFFLQIAVIQKQNW